MHSTLTLCSRSGLNASDGSTFFHGLPDFSFHPTEPSQGQTSGSFWSGAGEGPQYLHQDLISPQGQTQNSFSDSFHTFQEAQTGHNNGRSSLSGSIRNHWNAELPSAHMKSEEMSRYPSQDSIGAQSQRTDHSSTVNSSDQNRSVRMYPNVPQMSYHMSSARSDITGRSNSPESFALYTPAPQMEIQAFDTFPYTGGDDLAEGPAIFHRDSTAGIASNPMSIPMTTGRSYPLFASAGDESFMSLTQGPNSHTNSGPVTGDSVVYKPSTIIESPTLWDNGTDFVDSRGSSPVLLEDPWALPPHLMTSTTNSPLEYSPSVEGLSPRYVPDYPDLVELPPYATTGDRVVRRAVGPRLSKVASDLASRNQRVGGTSEASDESLKLAGRSGLELDHFAREHPLYHNVTPHTDGLYHCPWENKPDANCQHKPDKLKCNYEYDPNFLLSTSPFDADRIVFASKFVDSHLKPYKCKVAACKELQFSSTACRLRHEREAHAMHGHGDKPFLCTFEGCERGVTGNGFPRHWNLRDHMKRVHPGQPKSNASGSPPASGPVKGKKRKAGDQDTLLVEKTPRRVGSSPVVMRQPQEPSLIDHYNEKHKLLLDTVKQLQDARNADNMTLLRNANDCIKVMAQTTHRIRAAQNMGHIDDQRTG